MRKLLAVVICLSLIACGGPRRPLEVGTREFPASILLGEKANRFVPPPPSQSNPDLAFFPGFIQPPIPRTQPGQFPQPGPTLGPCPPGDPNDASDIAAFNRAPKRPVPATYVFRNNGKFEIVGKQRSEYPPTSTRTVKNVRNIDQSRGAVIPENYEYDLEIAQAGTITTTTYQVINDPSDPKRGVYMTQVVAPGPRGRDSFRPDPPILLMPFPPPEFGTNLEDEVNTTTQGQYRSSGTDPLTQTTMVVEARINPQSPKLRADACGRWVDGWDIEITFGRIVSNGTGGYKDISFTGHYSLATQYGALIVRDEIQMSGQDGEDSITSANVATINSVPLEPT